MQDFVLVGDPRVVIDIHNDEIELIRSVLDRSVTIGLNTRSGPLQGAVKKTATGFSREASTRNESKSAEASKTVSVGGGSFDGDSAPPQPDTTNAPNAVSQH